jgi:repressor LexA
MTNSLHPTQERLLTLLVENGDSPLTISAMQDLLGVSSKSVVFHHLRQLERKGYLKRNPHNPRDYHVLSEGPEKKFTYLNLYGLAHCGPEGSILDDSPLDRIPIPARLISFPAKEAFLVQAKGDSMIPKIDEGDLLVARKTNSAESGNIVVCVNNGEALIKKLQRDKQDTLLVSTNPKYAPFSASKEDFRIVGLIKAVMSHHIR